MIRWYLEGFFQSESNKTQQPMHDFPVILGRDETLPCVVSAPSVSRNHAKISMRDNQLWLEDMESRNGTFVNRKPITDPVEVFHGDVVHLGTAEIRLIDTLHSKSMNDVEEEDNSGETKFISTDLLSEKFPSGVRELEQLIADRAVAMVFQPIIKAPELSTVGYEVLGRGASPDLPNSPLDLFRIAESFELEVQLSEVMRNKGVETAVAHGLKGDLLVNTHPTEMKTPERLLDSLSALRKRFPHAPITLEIHEQSVTGNSDLLRSIKQKLDTLSMKLAFDDFGVGQSRFMEMVEAKPDLIKYDRALIDRIDEGDESRISLLRHLKEMATDLSIETLAECVSSEGEYRVCETMNFEYYQGFYFAKPQPPENFSR
ncbi:MAG: EAL domain-containing protein [Agarilytica sp.]